MEAPKKISLVSDLSIKCIVRTWLRNIGLIGAAAAILAMAASLYVSWFHVPQYEATMTYAIMAKEDSLSTADHVNASKEVTSVMTELIKTDIITQQLRKADERLLDFGGTLRAAQVGDTNLITVTARDPSAELAFLALDALEEIFPELSGYLSGTAVVQVIRQPRLSPAPANGVNVGGMMVRSGILGAVAMAALLALWNITRGAVQTRDGAKRLLDAQILATVSHEQKNRSLRAVLKRTNKGLQVFAPTTSAAYTEQINRVCTRLEQARMDEELHCFLVTGVGENEGKSTIAANVAAALGMKGESVVLVDGDLRKPAMRKFFDDVYECEIPFEKLLASPYEPGRLHKSLYRYEKLGLGMLFAGGPEEKSMQLLAGPTMAACLQELRREFDYIIIDTPPMGFFPDAEALAELADASLLVVRQDDTPACDVNDAVDTLRKSGSKFLGCVLNDMEPEAIGGKGYGYGYGYGARNRAYGSGKRD